MNKWLRRVAIGLIALLVIAGGAYYWLVVQSGTPSGTYTIDIAQVRRLADALPGDKPIEIRVEQLERGSFPAAAIVAGDGWAPSPMAMFSYQVVFPHSTTVIDSGFDPKAVKKNGMQFDGVAQARMSNGLNDASLILFTHEHEDHIGGFLAQPNVRTLLGKARINGEQVANAARYNSEIPPNVFTGYQATSYKSYLAVAPGVVLIRAAGHTPGSQMIYVKTVKGQEFLFIGDVAWHMRNIELVRERARLVTMFMLREDSDAVLAQLQSLKQLGQKEPKIFIVPGHDLGVVTADLAAGALQRNFR